ncbi:PadR family transcriptional regulator [Streptomyces alboflavus]|uniref:PadR family transcriptional regulator n=1 Tax=Streptomyces alboflavus TaxID=67267 RepID=UPI0036BBB75F
MAGEEGGPQIPKPPKATATPGTSTTTGTSTGGTSTGTGTGTGTGTAGSDATGTSTTGTGTAGTSTAPGTVHTAWTRAALPLCLLAILDTEKQSYGYALLNRLTTAGLDGVKAATLYPALTRLEEDGSVEIEWGAGEGGPGRKYYRITDAGRARLHHDRTAWAAFTHSVAALTGTDAPNDPDTARPTPHAAEPGEPT